MKQGSITFVLEQIINEIMEYLNKNNLNKVRKNLNESPKYDNFFRMEKP